MRTGPLRRSHSTGSLTQASRNPFLPCGGACQLGPVRKSGRGSLRLPVRTIMVFHADPRHPNLRKALAVGGVLLGAYGLLAYVALPMAWTHYEHQRGLEGQPMLTRTEQGLPGGPLNIGLVGSQEDVVHAMHAAHWYPADPITLRTSLEIVSSVLLDRPDLDAPVSPLF